MTVIKQLQIKVIFSIIFVQAGMLAGLLVFLNYSFRVAENRKAQNFLIQLAKHNGHRPPPERYDSVSPGTYFPWKRNTDTHTVNHKFSSLNLGDNDQMMRNYFAVNVSYAGVINEIIKEFPINYTNEEISELIISIRATNHYTGTVGDIRFLVTPAAYGNDLICLLNIKNNIETQKKLLLFSVMIFVLSGLVTSFLSLIISSVIIKPTRQSIEKQNQFIADVSHELRTPIAVIGANIDVLETEIGDNKWFKYIKEENKRMGELVRDLLYLAKNDSGMDNITIEDFDFSNAIENAVLPFEVIAFENNMRLNIKIQPNIVCLGNEKELKQIAVILVDNAIKNSEPNAVITITVLAEKDKILLKVHNTGNGIPKEEMEKIFRRFYRSDSSRARKTGGYGLGLSIAQTIAKKHEGTLTVASELEKYTEFTLTLPKKTKKL